jgi:hypothetical protein
VEADLPRIQAMGVDVVWLMPIHPIGRVHRKGKLGSPYSIRDSYGVNPEFGSKADLSRLIGAAHDLHLKVMLDIVFNHTAHDAKMREEHPEWYELEENDAGGVLEEWTDVVPLRRASPGLYEYFIDVLQYWAAFGADGFRCDVASSLPLDFWLEARRAVQAVKSGIIWLGESPHATFVSERRQAGFPVLSDSELYQAFDILYDQDHLPAWRAAVDGALPVWRYLELLRLQDSVYPSNYVKMRFVENHDRPRIMALARSRSQALAWTAFQSFNKGALLIYAGQESEAKRSPSLFDRTPIAWDAYSLQPLLAKLAALKKDPVQIDGEFFLLQGEPVIQAAWQGRNGALYGIFNVQSIAGDVRVSTPDGSFEELLTGKEVCVNSGRTAAPPDACIFRIKGETQFEPFYSFALDYLSFRDKPAELVTQRAAKTRRNTSRASSRRSHRWRHRSAAGRSSGAAYRRPPGRAPFPPPLRAACPRQSERYFRARRPGAYFDRTTKVT